ncbi:LOW QUALITY PROTEIN: hypothetical protein CVT25_010667 [Psilocybe cyanescens]|uniref:Uncharacterized protein n=1 Tax=Psilocybe cyanescens TaxID=93625 RepID=A0A409XTC0_PSICY|nr:LOW QUALITY PROTEIN: hypothetical protein CVT25_010667 [Psilocybe cyanescens]
MNGFSAGTVEDDLWGNQRDISDHRGLSQMRRLKDLAIFEISTCYRQESNIFCYNTHIDVFEHWSPIQKKPSDPASESKDNEEELCARTKVLNIGLVPVVSASPSTTESDNEAIEDIPTPSHIENLRLTQAFIELIKNTTLNNGKLDETSTDRLQDPVTDPIDLSDPALCFSLDLYIACMNPSEATYNAVWQAIVRFLPDLNILSYHLAKKEVEEISGVVLVHDDMCINLCHAFTGSFADLDICTICSESQYTLVSNCHKKETNVHFPLGPQIQALQCSVQVAEAMAYQEHKNTEILEGFEFIDPSEAVYNDIFCGEDIRKLSEELDLTSNDTTVILSINSAQLYQNKKLDTWIGIWIVGNYNPKTHYQSKCILPVMVTPGPSKCKIMDSYLFCSLHYLSVIQKVDNGARIKVYNAAKDAVVLSQTVVFAANSDAPGWSIWMVICRKGCPMKGQHKPSSGHYFSAHLKPNNCNINDCNHPDFNFHDFTFQISPDTYNSSLTIVLESVDKNTYEKNCKPTGLSKPLILSRLHPLYILSIPLYFTIDTMHLFGLNLGEHLIPVWHGIFKCKSTDDKSIWDWATLVGTTWQSHGKLVAAATKFFPSFFHCPPRNPAEKISSGYKVTEYYLYLFGLGPGFFQAVLPKKYWKNFCKLVHGVHIIMQQQITGKQVQEAHSYLVQFVKEYEHLYYKRHMDQLHFQLKFSELGMGVLWINTPWNMPLVSLEKEFGSHQIHTEICAKFPSDVLRENLASDLSEAELDVIKQVCNKQKQQKWGHIHLPNGQIARSRYSEKRRVSEDTRITHNVKIHCNGKPQFAEVQYFFLDRDSDKPGEPIAHAVLSLHGPPNHDMLVESSHTLHACRYTGQDNLCCLPVIAIDSVISMQPLSCLPDDPVDLWFVVEKSGLNDVQLVLYGEDILN